MTKPALADMISEYNETKAKLSALEDRIANEYERFTIFEPFSWRLEEALLAWAKQHGAVRLELVNSYSFEGAESIMVAPVGTKKAMIAHFYILDEDGDADQLKPEFADLD